MSVDDYLEFRLLKYILAVADAGTFTAAASKLFTSQSSLSAQIKQLEEALNFTIFDRDKGNVPTPEGAILLRFAQECLQRRESVIETMRAVHTGSLMPLRVGFSPLIEKDLLHCVTQTYKKLLPNCAILPEAEETDALVQRVQDGRLDAALLTLPIDHDDLQIQVLEREPLRLCMRQDDPLAEMNEVPVAALDGKLSLFAYPRHHPVAHAWLKEELSKKGITPRQSSSTLKMEHVQWLVQEGHCYSLVREKRRLLSGLVAHPIAGVNWTIDSALISRKDNRHPALPLLIRDLAEQFDQPHAAENSCARSSSSVRKPASPAVGHSSGAQLGLFAREESTGNRGHR
jgi:DNA-binding transcriptional LysR family regulator